MHSPHCKSLLSLAAAVLFAVVSTAGAAEPAKSSECAKIGICYCVSSEVKPAIEEKIARFRALIAEQHKAGKSVGYLSVPLSPAGGGFFNLNAEVAGKAKQAIEKRFGADFVWVLNPGMWMVRRMLSASPRAAILIFDRRYRMRAATSNGAASTMA